MSFGQISIKVQTLPVYVIDDMAANGLPILDNDFASLASFKRDRFMFCLRNDMAFHFTRHTNAPLTGIEYSNGVTSFHPVYFRGAFAKFKLLQD